MSVPSTTNESLARVVEVFPSSPLVALDVLWMQVSGTVCNLSCRHCFISCTPTNHNHAMMTLADVRRTLAEAAALGVREYYFTGGEPFLHGDLLTILSWTLRQGPATVLTNGLLLRPAMAAVLARLDAASEYSLDLRISLDGYDAASNDAVRGAGTFERVMDGIRNVAAAGMNPVITVTGACEGAETQAGRTRLLQLLHDIGLPRPRLKVLPLLHLGEEAHRSRGYGEQETLRDVRLQPADIDALQCSSCRMVTAKGVYVCPILVDEPAARMGETLAETRRPFELRYQACYTCHTTGLRCST